MIESGDERGKWDKKGAREGARGTFHGEMGKWQKMAQAMTLMKRMGGRDIKWTDPPTWCIPESTLPAQTNVQLSRVY